ncbi:MAG: hypothetical protein ABIN58_02605 [candidate division WOR-3 bacterium]
MRPDAVSEPRLAQVGILVYHLSMRPKGSAKELEVRRRIAAHMLSQGKSIGEVAKAIGVTSIAHS